MKGYFWIATILCLLSIGFHLCDHFFWHPAEDAMVKINEIDFTMKQMQRTVNQLKEAQRADTLDIFHNTEKFGLLESFFLKYCLKPDSTKSDAGMRYTAARDSIDHKYLRKKGFEGFERKATDSP